MGRVGGGWTGSVVITGDVEWPGYVCHCNVRVGEIVHGIGTATTSASFRFQANSIGRSGKSTTIHGNIVNAGSIAAYRNAVSETESAIGDRDVLTVTIHRNIVVTH